MPRGVAKGSGIHVALKTVYGKVLRSEEAAPECLQIRVSFHCCVAAWVSTSKHVFCQFGELCDWNIILPSLGPFMLTREYRMILRRKLTSLLKQHIAYRCALCASFVNGSKKDTLIQLQHRISAKSLMYLHLYLATKFFDYCRWVIRQQVSENQCTTFFCVDAMHVNKSNVGLHIIFAVACVHAHG